MFLVSPKVNSETGIIDQDIILLEWEYPFTNNKAKEIALPHNWQVIVKYSHKNNLVAMDEREELCIYDLDKRQYSRRLKLENNIKDLAWSHDDKYLAVVCGEKVKLLNFEDFSVVKQIEMQYACFVDFTTCGKFILIGSWNKGYFLAMEDFLNLE